MAIVEFPDKKRKIIKVTARKVSDGTILPPKEEVNDIIVEEHAADPIKNIDDIYRISSFLIENSRFRDNMLFITGINFGLRVSDLLQLRFCHLINEDMTFKDTIPIYEIKTRNTRKQKKNRYITINEAVMDAVILYLDHHPSSLSDYMFTSESNRGSGCNKPLNRKSVERILKGIGKDLGLSEHISTHTLRKTFGYHQMLMANNDPRKLLLLQKIFNHSSEMQTLQYIGITKEEMAEAYNNLNLGGQNHYNLVNSRIKEDVM